MDVRSFDPVEVFVHYALAELFLGSHLTVGLSVEARVRPPAARYETILSAAATSSGGRVRPIDAAAFVFRCSW